MLKKLVLLAVLVALAFGAYVMFLRPRPVQWQTELGVVPVPHCPYCDATLNPLSNRCPACKRLVLWEGKEKLKEDLRKTGDAIETKARTVGEAIQEEAEKLTE